MRRRYKQGANYELELGDDGVCVCRVHRRSELSREQGARCAEEQVVLLTELAARAATEVRALIFDLSDAPDVWGPLTQRALENMLAPWEVAHKRVVVVVGPEPIQRFNVESLIKSSVPSLGRIADSPADAEARLVKRK